MTISVDVQRITSASAHTIDAVHGGFDVVKINEGSSVVTLFLPENTGDAVAAAINAAIAPAVAEAAE